MIGICGKLPAFQSQINVVRRIHSCYLCNSLNQEYHVIRDYYGGHHAEVKVAPHH